ncbi:unnamed protein product [Rotaria sordida]|uniref:microtubule-severing ATPase n=1 Tax=Rotaria sordida TaxID=392033 RepID=A0A814VVA6_9BILA|nr:unnamed protein product [Rotaria sordida]CAF1190444.1 unnamed protein product [Rotaria sordida]CAF3718393.1 unnamed protein product [Rotaria sordida]
MENEPYKIQHDYQQQAAEYLRQALECDEQSKNHELAISLYKKGIEELEQAINVNIDPNDNRAIELRTKMRRNLAMAHERVEILQKLTQKDSNPVIKANVRPIKVQRPPRPRSSASTSSSASSNCHYRVMSPVSTSSSSTRLTPKLKEPPSKIINNRKRELPSTSNIKKLSIQNQNQQISLKLPNVEPKLVSYILDEVIENRPHVKFDDISGQEGAKRALEEAVILPVLRPEMFTGLRAPVRGILLFGPPGNGKTMLAKAVASEAKARFFNISASSLTSKYVGEGEKLVRALFAAARELQPSIIFIDEVDSLLTTRKESEHDAMRRLKTEFLIQFDGVQTNNDDRILVLAATNRPFELDDAALRRFPRRIYIQLPDIRTREQLLKYLLNKQEHNLTENDFRWIANETNGYSGSDLTALAKDAAMGPVRELDVEKLKQLSISHIRSISQQDFVQALKKIRASISTLTLDKYIEWNSTFGDCSS